MKLGPTKYKAGPLKLQCVVTAAMFVRYVVLMAVTMEIVGFYTVTRILSVICQETVIITVFICYLMKPSQLHRLCGING